MTISKIKFKAAMTFQKRGYQPPPRKLLTRDRCVWIAKMHELEQRENNSER